MADVIKQYGKAFLENNNLSYQKQKVLRAIVNCRTSALGGHLQTCSKCAYSQIAYNSCRNRHCPKCQIQQREKWIQQRLEQVLPVKYFHVVFTIPSELNKLCLQYPKQLYNTLFYAAWKTIQTFAADSKYLGAKTGMTSILHTWGQNLSLHPHLHCIVPSGGVDINNNWKVAHGKGKYLFPVEAMSIVFRAIFLKRLKRLYKKEDIQSQNLEDLVNILFEKSWVVYCKRAFLGPQCVIEYLGRYSHKVAISNHRIKDITTEKVVFSYKNYRNNKNGLMQLGGQEFIRRFSQHILPHRFVRIRHFGILGATNKALISEIQQHLIPQQEVDFKQSVSYPNWEAKPILCPKCKKGVLENIMEIMPIRAGPYSKTTRICA